MPIIKLSYLFFCFYITTKHKNQNLFLKGGLIMDKDHKIELLTPEELDCLEFFDLCLYLQALNSISSEDNFRKEVR